MNNVKAKLLDDGTLLLAIEPCHESYMELAATVWAKSGGKEVPGYKEKEWDSMEDGGLPPPEEHDYSCCMLYLSDGDNGEVESLLQMIQRGIDDKDLVDIGKEDIFHITVKYGLHTEDHNIVKNVVNDFGPVKVTLGVTSI